MHLQYRNTKWLLAHFKALLYFVSILLRLL